MTRAEAYTYRFSSTAYAEEFARLMRHKGYGAVVDGKLVHTNAPPTKDGARAYRSTLNPE